MKYSYGNTVLTWIQDDALISLIDLISKELKIDVFSASEEADIFGIPYFFALIDSRKIDHRILAMLKEVITAENPREFGILLTDAPKVKIPGGIKKYFIKPQEAITHGWLKATILNKKSAIARHKKNRKSIDKPVFRAVYILRKLIHKNGIVDTRKLSNEFNVSEKTIKRDIDLLKSMGEDITFDKIKKGYVLNFSINDTFTSNI